MDDKIIDFAATSSYQGFHCWSCHDALSVRALFCNHCGSIQPPREIDHFLRLGLDRRTDIDLATLDRHLETLQRTFANDRFTLRSQKEKDYAAKHREAIQAAYDALRDPISRSRYWLQLHDISREQAGQTPPVVDELQKLFFDAREPVDLDSLARRTGQEIESNIVKLLSTLREKRWSEATEILAALDGMETLITKVRDKRQQLTPHKK